MPGAGGLGWPFGKKSTREGVGGLGALESFREFSGRSAEANYCIKRAVVASPFYLALSSLAFPSPPPPAIFAFHLLLGLLALSVLRLPFVVRFESSGAGIIYFFMLFDFK